MSTVPAEPIPTLTFPISRDVAVALVRGEVPLVLAQDLSDEEMVAVGRLTQLPPRMAAQVLSEILSRP